MLIEKKEFSIESSCSIMEGPPPWRALFFLKDRLARWNIHHKAQQIAEGFWSILMPAGFHAIAAAGDDDFFFSVFLAAAWLMVVLEAGRIRPAEFLFDAHTLRKRLHLMILRQTPAPWVICWRVCPSLSLSTQQTEHTCDWRIFWTENFKRTIYSACSLYILLIRLLFELLKVETPATFCSWEIAPLSECCELN